MLFLVFYYAGAMTGAFGALVCAQVVARVRGWSLNWDSWPYAPVLLVLLLVGSTWGGLSNGFVAYKCGWEYALLSVSVTVPIFVAASALPVVAIPTLIRCARAMSAGIARCLTRGKAEK